MPSPTSDPAAPQWFWDRYWQTDRIAACLTNPITGNYEPAVRADWEQFFGDLASGARLLDIGTGNGALAIIAYETAARVGGRFDIHGVDRADIDPAHHVHASSVALAAIRFHARTAAESLPFPAGFFDAICGQYALEYTDLQRSLLELRRVAKPGAYLRFILHASGARPVETARMEMAEIDRAIETLHIIDLARALMLAIFRFEHAESYDAKLEAQARSARNAYRSAARILDAGYAQSPDRLMLGEILGSVRYAWEHRRAYTLDYVLKGIDAIETEVHAHRARLDNMCAVALSRGQAEDLCQKLCRAGFEDPKLSELRSNAERDFWGWELTAGGDKSPRDT